MTTNRFQFYLPARQHHTDQGSRQDIRQKHLNTAPLHI